jgi:sialic acid synthase SpsE
MLSLLKNKFKHILVSTGMAKEEEIKKAAQVLKGSKFTFLHCVSVYPTPLEKVNMLRMDWLRNFTDSVGYSDHSIGIEAVKLAIIKGASFVEKHFTLGKGKCLRTMPWDATEKEFAEIIKYREICVKMLGNVKLIPDRDILFSRKRFICRFGNNK